MAVGRGVIFFSIFFGNYLQPYFLSYASPSEKFWSLESKSSIVRTFYVLTMIKLHSKLIIVKILV